MGESKVLLCKHRYSEDVMVKLEFKIHSASTILSVPDNSAPQSYLSSCDAQCLSSLF